MVAWSSSVSIFRFKVQSSIGHLVWFSGANLWCPCFLPSACQYSWLQTPGCLFNGVGHICLFLSPTLHFLDNPFKMIFSKHQTPSRTLVLLHPKMLPPQHSCPKIQTAPEKLSDKQLICGVEAWQELEHETYFASKYIFTWCYFLLQLLLQESSRLLPQKLGPPVLFFHIDFHLISSFTCKAAIFVGPGTEDGPSLNCTPCLIESSSSNLSTCTTIRVANTNNSLSDLSLSWVSPLISSTMRCARHSFCSYREAGASERMFSMLRKESMDSVVANLRVAAQCSVLTQETGCPSQKQHVETLKSRSLRVMDKSSPSW